ncbi:glycosyltransferase family 4 protein [Pseudomonas sp. BBP2017]|uniref:glycosyltransferase family 4 protein n=1 Tax=Pseudomonas sp. BBP2017 TaxID=2109731 RepID=UPI000D12114C|nr:glycosyltransferase family 4 protein [Pseudomonas sp. BBP2017]PSS47910.1 glycosyltransferase WbuB [Pseudomonas sp. BBP2017]
MKSAWILNHYAQEPGAAGGTRHYSLAKHLRASGWNASIVAASVDHQSGRQRLANDEFSRLEYHDSVPFLWLKTSPYSGNGGGRMRNMLEFAARLVFSRALKKLPKPDVIVGSSVHLFTGLAGLVLAWRYKVPFVFEVRDLWPQTLIDMGRLKERSLVTRILRVLELFIYRRSQRIVVLLPAAWQYIVPLGIPKSRIEWIPNGADLSSFPYYPISERLNRSCFTLMYLGAHGQANGLVHILEAMKIANEKVTDSKILLRMVGDGPLKSDLIRHARALGLDNVFFEESVTKTQVPELAREADAFLISVLDLPNLYRFGISMNKLFDYLAAGRPTIIASGAVNNPIADAGAGITVSPVYPEEMADAIVKLASAENCELEAMGLAGRRYVEANHEYAKLANRFADVLNDVVNEAR